MIEWYFDFETFDFVVLPNRSILLPGSCPLEALPFLSDFLLALCPARLRKVPPSVDINSFFIVLDSFFSSFWTSILTSNELISQELGK